MTRHKVASVGEMEALAVRVAGKAKAGDVFLLSGELGAGKSVFARAFLKARGAGGDIPSPTFTLLQYYELPSCPVYHFDLYRLRAPEEIEEIGFEEALEDAIALVEWPEKAASYMPRNATRIRIEIISDEEREVWVGEEGC